MAIVLTAIGVVVTACGETSVPSSGTQLRAQPTAMTTAVPTAPIRDVETRPSGLRVFSVRSGIVCNVFDYGPGNSVKGILRLTPGEEDVAWIEGDGGRHQSILWPEGFVLELEPKPALLSDRGRLIGHDGDPIRLNNTAPDEAAGTFDDPYLAHGRTLFGCYP